MDNDASGQPGGLTSVGTVIADRYRLVAHIAGGGMGEVWRAVDEVLGRTVALKLLRPEYADDEEFRERFRREARAASAISDIGVVPVFDFGEVERRDAPPMSYLVMEYVDGLTLAAEVSALGPLGAERTLLILEQTASALQAAHDAGVIHRDIKPGNIMVTPHGDLKITDFGIAHAGDSVPLTRTGTMTGTAKYLSPEQARGQPATAASDLYSLGVVAYACLTGQVPFGEGNDISIALAHVQQMPRELPEDVPAGLRELIMRMLEKKPSDRPPSAGAVAAAARSLRRDEATNLDRHLPLPPANRVGDVAADQMADPTKTIGAAGVAADATPASGTTATQTVVVAAPETLPEQLPGTTDGPPEQAAPSARRRGLRRGAIALLLLLAAGAAFLLWQSGGTQVPDVVGKQRDEARTILTNIGLRPKFVVTDVPDKKKGIVVEQSENAGSEVDEGSTITLTVASGKVALPTERLLGATYDEAAATLDSLGLTATRRTVFSTSSPGTVIAVDPDKRAEVGSTVTLTVAAAPSPTATKPKDKGSGNNKGTEPTAEPSPSPTPEPTATPTPTPEPSATPTPTPPPAGG